MVCSGGKRKGAFAIYLEPWHADIMAFLDLRKNHGVEEERGNKHYHNTFDYLCGILISKLIRISCTCYVVLARDLFYGLWVCDLFMKRVEQDGSWSLFCKLKHVEIIFYISNDECSLAN